MIEWQRQQIDRRYRAGGGREEDHAGLSGLLLRLIREEPLHQRTILDVGCGSGRLACTLANEAGRIIGIDRSSEAIERARRQAASLGFDRLTFSCRDAESVEYRDLGPIDLVVANLCMSDEILRRAAAALAPGRFIIFAAFHQDQWKESGKISRYAYSEERLETALLEAGFEPVHLAVEREVLHFATQDEALSYVDRAGMSDKWKADSRWSGFLTYLTEGGRQLTIRGHVIVKARRRESFRR